MANKLDNAMAAIRTKLAELVTSGKLAAVIDRPLDPASYSKTLPVASVAWMGDLYRESDSWIADVAVAILVRGATTAASDELIELIGLVDAKLTALQSASGTLGGNMDRPRWSPWYHGPSNFTRVGAVAGIRLTVADPLTIPA